MIAGKKLSADMFPNSSGMDQSVNHWPLYTVIIKGLLSEFPSGFVRGDSVEERWRLDTVIIKGLKDEFVLQIYPEWFSQ